MEVLSMLRYWRGGAGSTTTAGGGSCSTGKDANANPGSSSSSGHTTITTSAFLPPSYDEGPFFDLHLAVPDDAAAAEGEIDSNFEEAEDARESIKSVEFSAADGEEVVFKGRLVPIDSSSVIIDENTHLAGPLVKSNTKLSVFFLGLKKPATSIGSVLKLGSDYAAAEGTSAAKEKSQNHRFFTVKFKGEELRLVSFFTRENSRNGSKLQNKLDSSEDGSSPATETATDGISGEVKGKAKVTVQKYLNAIKPLYEKVAKKNGDNYKAGFSGNLSTGRQGKGRCATGAGSQDSVPSGPVRQGSFPSGLKVVYKHFGKSRSASWPASTGSSSSSSSAAAAASAAAGSGLQAQRRDDSLLQQQDGIQSAIAHCKQSFSFITDR